MSKQLALVVGLALGLVVGVSSCREPCTTDTCFGCCDAKGECRPGTEAAACGRRADTCAVCPGTCVRQACVAPSGTDGGTQEDGGSPGVDGGGCVVGQCGSQVCSLVTGQCEVPGACDVLQPQPAGCGQGHLCAAGTCADVRRPTCANFSSTSAPLRWNPATQFGPVLTGAQALSFTISDAGCPTGALKRGIAELSAYDFQARFADGGFPRLFLYRENATLTEVRADQVPSVTPSNGGANVVLQVAVCVPDATAMLTQGFAFENGNGVCVTFR
jgi:hypothetical protein